MVLYAQQIATSSGSILPRAIAHPNLFALASLYYSLLDSWHVYCAGWSWIPTKNSFAKSFSKMASLEENLMYIPFALMGINFILSGLFVNFIQLILWLTVKPWNIKLYHQCMYYCVYAVWGRKWIFIFINFHVYMLKHACIAACSYCAVPVSNSCLVIISLQSCYIWLNGGRVQHVLCILMMKHGLNLEKSMPFSY